MYVKAYGGIWEQYSSDCFTCEECNYRFEYIYYNIFSSCMCLYNGVVVFYIYFLIVAVNKVKQGIYSLKHGHT